MKIMIKIILKIQLNEDKETLTNYEDKKSVNTFHIILSLNRK